MAKVDFEYRLEAKRGFVYLFKDDNAKWKDKYVLVVSDDSRAMDKIVSVVVLGDSANGHDVVPVTIPNIGVKYAHCGMVTYMGRHLLNEEIFKVNTATIKAINKQIISNMGLIDTEKMIEYNNFKQEYNNLLDKLMDGGFRKVD